MYVRRLVCVCVHDNVLRSVLFSSCVVRGLELEFGSVGDPSPSFPAGDPSLLGGSSFSGGCSVVSSGLCEKISSGSLSLRWWL